MTNSRVKPVARRHLAAGLALFASISVPGAAALAQQANTLQAPSGMQPLRPVPQSLAEPSSESGQAEPASGSGPQSIVPPGFGATSPSSVSGQEISRPSRYFPAGSETKEPSVRVLSSIPGRSGSGIEVGRLSGVDASTAGLISVQEGGFGADMWRGASRADIDSYLSRLPVPSRSPVMGDLARRLLLTGAQPPEGAGSASSLLATRLDLLVASGHAEAALELAQAAGRERSPGVAAALARAALARGDESRACDALKDIPPGDDPAHDRMAAFSVKLSTYCQIAGGNQEIASLTLDLAREEGLDDPLFYSLASEAAAGIVLRAPEPNELGIVDAAFYRLAKRDLPGNAAAIAAPALLPSLLDDPSIPVEQKVEAAERAAAYGLINGRQLAAYYRKPRFTPEQMAGLLTSDIPESSPLRRAMIYQAIGSAIAADERMQLFKLALATAETSGLYYPTVEALYPALADMKPNDALRPLAPAATRAFIAIGERGKAREWLALVSQGGQTLGRDARELSGLMRVSAASANGFDSKQLSAEIIADLKSGVKSTQLYAASEAMLLDGLGFQLDPAVWDALLDARGALTGKVPPEALLNQLQTAGAKNAIGETVMLALDAIGQAGPGGVHPRASSQAVSSLRAVGLESEARRLALEALMARSNAGRG